VPCAFFCVEQPVWATPRQFIASFFMKITEHIHALKIPFEIQIPGGLAERFVNVFLIYGEKIYLIDSGVSGAEGMIFDYLKATSRRPDDIGFAFLTHAHPDHIGSVREIKNKTGCSIAVHPAERPWVEDVELQFKERPVPGFHKLIAGSAPVDRDLRDGEVIELEKGLHLKTLHVPGHSKGSVAFLLEEDRALFTGDAIPIPGDLPIYDDFVFSVRSLEKLKTVKNINILLSSWDEPRAGEDIAGVINQGVDYLLRIHNSVLKAESGGKKLSPSELCRAVVSDMGLPFFAVNPLVARSFLSHQGASV
jgi:glyoxylase-like metal-dependent hydrolase (beta-lactamase superfamily II)